MIDITLKFNDKQINLSEVFDENRLQKELQGIDLNTITTEVKINNLPALKDALANFKIETTDDLVCLYRMVNELNQLDIEDLLKINYLICSGDDVENAIFNYSIVDFFGLYTC